MKKNYHQIRAYKDTARFQYWLAGRRGGKTYALARRILDIVAKSPPKSRVVYVGPSIGQAEELMWEPMLDLFEQSGWTFKDRISKKTFYLPGRRKFQIVGAERPNRARGHGLHHIIFDEIAFFSKPLTPIWRATRPTLSDYGGGATFATTPDGKGTEAYTFWMDALLKEANGENWSTHFWKTIDNPWIPPEEIEEAKRDLDEKSFLQEYEASWESFEGLAYYAFDENINLKKQPPINRDLDLKLCFDFNVNPTTLLLSQKEDGLVRYKQEYSLKNSSTEQTVLQFCEDYKEHTDVHLRIRGDSSGNNRSSTTGWSDYKYVQDILTDKGFRFSLDIPRRNPPIVDRVKHVNSWLRAFDGTHRIEIDPSCRELIRDLASQPLNGRHPDPKNNLGHKADALGYDIYWEEIHTKTREHSSIIL